MLKIHIEDENNIKNVLWKMCSEESIDKRILLSTEASLIILGKVQVTENDPKADSALWKIRNQIAELPFYEHNWIRKLHAIWIFHKMLMAFELYDEYDYIGYCDDYYVF